MSRQLRILVDGGSGSGKTTFARALQQSLAGELGSEVQLVHLDDCYPGWQGLAEASRMVWQLMLRDEQPGYWRYDWALARVTGWIDIHPSHPLIVEGCGSITPQAATKADWRVWMNLKTEERKRRALLRDGGGFDAHWDEWACQEAFHWANNHPAAHANVLIDRLVQAG